MPTRVKRDPPKGQGPGAQLSLLPRLRLPPCLLLKARAEVFAWVNTMRIRFDNLSPMWKWLKHGAPIAAMRLRSAPRVAKHADVLGEIYLTKVAQPPWGRTTREMSLTRLGGATDWVRHQQA